LNKNVSVLLSEGVIVIEVGMLFIKANNLF